MEPPFINPDNLGPNFNEPLKDFLSGLGKERGNFKFLTQIITNCGKCVVRLNLEYSGQRYQPLGSGILFQMNRKVCIQTCQHVLKDQGDIPLRRIAVDVEGREFDNIVSDFWGGCKKQDRAIFGLTLKATGDLKTIPDITPFAVDVKVGDKSRRKPFKGLIEYHSNQHGFIVHALKLPTPPRLDADTTVTCTFLVDKSSTVCSIRDVCYCSETGCAIIFVDNDAIPTKARELFKGRSWLEDISNPLVFVISYPNPDSRLKYISFGKLYEGVRYANGDLQYERTDKLSLEIEYSGEKGPEKSSGIYYTDDKDAIHPYQEEERGTVGSEGGNSTNRVKNIFRRDSDGNMFYLQLDYRTQLLYTTKNNNSFMPIQNVVFAHNDAVTEKGSSGGCVLIIGVNKCEPNKYKHILNMHYGKSIQPPVNKSIMYDYFGE